MADTRLGEPPVGERCDACPCGAVPLAAPPQRAPPSLEDVEAERRQRVEVVGYGVVVEPADRDLTQPVPDLIGRLMLPPHELRLDLLHLGPQPIAPALALDEEPAVAIAGTDVREAKEVEALRLAVPALLTVRRREAAELEQAGLLRMQRQPELSQPISHRCQQPLGVVPVLHADYDIVGVADNDDGPAGLAPSPALGPQVEDIMQVTSVRQIWPG